MLEHAFPNAWAIGRAYRRLAPLINPAITRAEFDQVLIASHLAIVRAHELGIIGGRLTLQRRAFLAQLLCARRLGGERQ